MRFNNFHGNPKTNLLCRLNDVLLVCCKTGICRKRIIIYTWHRRRSADGWINPVWNKPETWVNSPCHQVSVILLYIRPNKIKIPIGGKKSPCANKLLTHHHFPFGLQSRFKMNFIITEQFEINSRNLSTYTGFLILCK